MKQLKVNPRNERYYTRDFISGFRCGTKRQFESDLTILDKIKAETEQIEINGHIKDAECFEAGINTVLNIIDKYTREDSKDEKF